MEIASNSNWLLSNWILTYLLNETAAAVNVFAPKTNAWPVAEGVKAAAPFEVDFINLAFAPDAGREVTFIVYVWAACDAGPSDVITSVWMYDQVALAPPINNEFGLLAIVPIALCVVEVPDPRVKPVAPYSML